MPSTESDALRAHYQSMTDRMAADPGMDLVTLRSMFEELADRAKEPEGVTYAEVDDGEVHGLWCRPVDAADDRVILYTHGGGFVANSSHSHRKLAGHLAKATGVTSFVVEYRRAPEHPFPAQLEDGVTAYRWLVGRGFQPEHIATAGDSAGGNLAIGIPLKLRELGEPLPAAAVAFSPWLDMQHLGKTLDSNAETDAVVSRAVVELMSTMYLGEHGDPTDPLASPLYADPTGLPPLHITAGEHETLLDDSQRFADKALGAGLDVTFTTAPEQQHVYPFMVGRAPEADAAVRDAGDWVRPRLGLA